MTIRFVESRRYAPNELVIEEGQDSEEAYVIRSGSVEILKRNAAGRKVRIAILDEGEIFGEMGLILDRPRSATVRACSDLVVDVIDPACFTTLFEGEAGQKLRPIIQVLSERLRLADSRRAELESNIGGAEEIDQPLQALRVYLMPASDKAKTALQGKESVEIDKYPFRIGRYDPSMPGNLFHVNDLFLLDEEPFRVSPSHFAIFRSHNSCYVQDRGSKYGCVVNEIRVGGGHKNVSRVALHVGENDLAVGSAPSDLNFKIFIEKQQAPPESLWKRVRGHLGFLGS